MTSSHWIKSVFWTTLLVAVLVYAMFVPLLGADPRGWNATITEQDRQADLAEYERICGRKP